MASPWASLGVNSGGNLNVGILRLLRCLGMTTVCFRMDFLPGRRAEVTAAGRFERLRSSPQTRAAGPRFRPDDPAALAGPSGPLAHKLEDFGLEENVEQLGVELAIAHGHFQNLESALRGHSFLVRAVGSG